MSSPSPSDVYDCAIYVPRISRSLLNDLAGHLSQCCGNKVEGEVHDGAARVIEVASARFHGKVAHSAPSASELASALATVKRAAALMAEFLAVGRQIGEYDEIERSLHVLMDRISQYECSFDLVAEQLREAKVEAEEYQRRCVTAEHKLDLLTGAVLKMFGGALPSRFSAVEHDGTNAT